MLVVWSCPTLCDPMDSSLPGSSVHGILQARILNWVAIPLSKGSPDPEIEPRSPLLQADSLSSEPLGKPVSKPNSCYLLKEKEALPFYLIFVLPFLQALFYHLGSTGDCPRRRVDMCLAPGRHWGGIQSHLRHCSTISPLKWGYLFSTQV